MSPKALAPLTTLAWLLATALLVRSVPAPVTVLLAPAQVAQLATAPLVLLLGKRRLTTLSVPAPLSALAPRLVWQDVASLRSALRGALPRSPARARGRPFAR
jgi:hypothetical protein